MELKDTVERMLSDDYKERLIAEYQQLEIRIEKLKDAIFQYGMGKSNWTTDQYSLYQKQFDAMHQYQLSLTNTIISAKIPGFGCFGDTCSI